MQYLGIEQNTLAEKGAIHTAKEISQQPALWKKIYEAITKDRDDIQAFLNQAVAASSRIILTGAGTSAFIGLSLKGIFQRKINKITEAIPTTHLVSHPQDHFFNHQPVFMISFARSGNSPESEAAVMLAEQLCRECYHLIITCNPEGKLANAPVKQKYVLSLPPESNDQSLAMTSSYSGMLLAGLLIARLDEVSNLGGTIETLVRYGEKVIRYYADDLKQIAEKPFTRAVFLGAGPLFGTATESQLKLQELSDGRVICKEDSFLGFRHGPKAVIDEDTLVVYLFSNNEYARQYERDFVLGMKKGNTPLMEVGIMETHVGNMELDHVFCFSESGPVLSEEFLAVCGVVPAQILGFYKSLWLGLKPDSPSASGAISRVVEGVQIYSLK